VESSAVSPSAVHENMHCEAIETLEDFQHPLAIVFQQNSDLRFWVEHQENVCADGIGQVEEEAEGVIFSRPATPHVGDHKKSGITAFLEIPELPTRTEILLRHALGLS